MQLHERMMRKGMLTVKIHDAGKDRTVIALCDSALIGKTIEENGIHLNLASDFYKGEEKTEKEIKALLKDAYIVNFVGEKSVKLGIEAGLIDQQNIIRIRGV